MLIKFNLPSVNQLAAKIKLVEVWKAINKEDYPIVMDKYNWNIEHTHELREQSNRIFDDSCKLKKSELSFHVDAAKLWNLAPTKIKNAVSMHAAKREIDIFCMTLPT